MIEPDNEDYDEIDATHDGKVRDEVHAETDAAFGVIMFSIASAIRAQWADERSILTSARELVENNDATTVVALLLVSLNNIADSIEQISDSMQLSSFVFGDFMMTDTTQ